MTGAAPGHDTLLEAAGRVLERAGFAVRIELLEESDRSWLLAENELFALGAIAGETLDELQRVESTATEALLGRLGGLDGGAKRWDAYLLLLTPQPWRALNSRERVELVYNTRGIRRLIGAELIPDEAGDIENAVASVLTAFLPLRDPLDGGLDDLDGALVTALIVNGVDREAAPRYVAAYRARGSLDDV
jgi:hypothetical protein